MVNLHEGGRRMKAAGFTALKIGGSIIVFELLANIILTYTDAGFYAKNLPLNPLLYLYVFACSIWLVVGGAVLAVAGWIVQGFGTPGETPSVLPDVPAQVEV